MPDLKPLSFREPAWLLYQAGLGNKTATEEAQIERAFKAGWSECEKAGQSEAIAIIGRLAEARTKDGWLRQDAWKIAEDARALLLRLTGERSDEG
jgi:hypothetical protein